MNSDLLVNIWGLCGRGGWKELFKRNSLEQCLSETNKKKKSAPLGLVPLSTEICFSLNLNNFIAHIIIYIRKSLHAEKSIALKWKKL